MKLAGNLTENSDGKQDCSTACRVSLGHIDVDNNGGANIQRPSSLNLRKNCRNSFNFLRPSKSRTATKVTHIKILVTTDHSTHERFFSDVSGFMS